MNPARSPDRVDDARDQEQAGAKVLECQERAIADLRYLRYSLPERARPLVWIDQPIPLPVAGEQ